MSTLTKIPVQNKSANTAVSSNGLPRQAAAGKVILHTPEPASSPALYIHALATALAEEGLAVDVVCPANLQTRPKLESNPLIHVHPNADRSTGLQRGLLQRTLGNLAFLCSSIAALVRASKPGCIVHFQYIFHFPWGALFFLAACLRRSKIVFTVHDPLPHKWLLPASLRRLERGSLAWAYRVSDILIVHSEPGRRTLIDQFQIAAGKISVIAHGPYSLGRGILPMRHSDKLEVLLFGALRENKGAHLAIEAVQALFRERIAIRLTIAGAVLNGKEREYWDRCRALISDCPEPIRLLEQFIPDEQLPELFAGCHCLILPYTKFYSDSGVAYMALANGRPIIATKAGGLATLLESSGGGFAIEEATVGGVSAALKKAAHLGPEYLANLGRTGTARVMAECGWPVVARATLQRYASLLPDAHPGLSQISEGIKSRSF